LVVPEKLRQFAAEGLSELVEARDRRARFGSFDLREEAHRQPGATSGLFERQPLLLAALADVVADLLEQLLLGVEDQPLLAEDALQRLVELLGLAPALDAFGDGSLDGRELQRRLNVSKTTSYRFTQALGEMELIEKSAGRYKRTAAGDEIVRELSSFETTVRTTLTLAPILEGARDTTAPIPIEAFADATITTVNGGDAYGQVDRFIALVEETDTLWGIDLNSIVPLYIDEITQPVLNGMELEMIDTPTTVEDTVDKFPYTCAKLCVNGNVTSWLHDELPFGLSIFDDRVGIGVQGPDERRLRAFVDTDSAAVYEWATAVYESYRDESIRLEPFSKKALRETLPHREMGAST